MMHISGTAREKDVTKNAIALTRAPKSNLALPSAPLGLGAAAAPSAARAVVRVLARALGTIVARALALETRVVDASRARGVGVDAPMDKPSRRRVVARAPRSRATRPRAARARAVAAVVVVVAASAIVAVVASRRVARCRRRPHSATMQRADDADAARAARWSDEAKASVKEHALRMKRAAVRDATRDGDAMIERFDQIDWTGRDGRRARDDD